MKITVRTALLADAKPIARILSEVGWFEEFNRQDPNLQVERVRSFLRETLNLEERFCKVAVNETGLVIGYAHGHLVPYFFLPQPELYLSELFVAPLFQNQGVGSLLLQKVEAQAQDWGAGRICLCAGRHRPSFQQGFYPKKGFTEKDRAVFQKDLA
ncbi:MAG: hypothetical protein A2600_11675 [Candidatus Lambdaproteobacteria bacterium RIFOXYD1_FULL_56_27]|uniref:N-acetyltransferase domain-containing protein n=1 Tax=Candidatus Lambdaproteobacteria bacterium RIFOXYD2_FULL_56_26 TaxID=1817773 RepID=A0A1F6GYN2_9PROT|nr:MAG: hypothetical protein A2426_06305 [Candidatus Lambdaproteobacteria bacterium RIFOXYC1_FULL_56_13]OGH03255.1 MAG: hypothetical protein A2557_00850 [Candidatus Lambdaproteobacteria bacterium RIFOXYD2_FULL_56_26]OGH08192.1 MAG: hypothetical protein A2600_11675 [Candidatus Lambdaproteobacteria bacterium RIFOXYD1_FULL_56_27]